MKNILLTIAYDGSGFHGWQRQANARTVQGTLEEALKAVANTAVSLEGASRTDAGVHAIGQRATLRGSFGIPTERIPIALNSKLHDVTIISAEEKPEGFHARFDAAGKTYVYRFAVAPSIQAFLRNHACLLARMPNTDKMAEAAKHIEGTHDFACFQAAGGIPRATTVRTVSGIFIRTDKVSDIAGNKYEEIEISVTGDGFLYNMVRIIAGTLADVGYEKIAPREVEEIIAQKDRAQAGATAPPQGLYLKEVFYY